MAVEGTENQRNVKDFCCDEVSFGSSFMCMTHMFTSMYILLSCVQSNSDVLAMDAAPGSSSSITHVNVLQSAQKVRSPVRKVLCQLYYCLIVCL